MYVEKLYDFIERSENVRFQLESRLYINTKNLNYYLQKKIGFKKCSK